MFITLEGSEGSGKTSQHALLVDFLKAQGYPVLTTREPGGTPIGEQVRRILSDLDNTAMHPRSEILLFQASRAQLVEQVIRPHLAAGGVVVCDRYADSTMAYQGYGYQLVPLDLLASIVQFATGGLKPDLTLLLDLDVQEGLQRRARGGDWNRLDAYDLAFYRARAPGLPGDGACRAGSMGDHRSRSGAGSGAGINSGCSVGASPARAKGPAPRHLEIVVHSPKATPRHAAIAAGFPQIGDLLLDILRALTCLQPAHHLVELRSHVLSHFPAHLAHHAPQRLRIILQAIQAARVRQRLPGGSPPSGRSARVQCGG